MRGFISTFNKTKQSLNIITNFAKERFKLFLMEPYLKSAASGNLHQLLTNLKEVQKIDVRDNVGWTALMMAARYGHLNITRELLTRGCDPDILNQSGQTAQDIAEFCQHKDIVNLLSSTTTHPQPRPSNYLCNSPLDRSSHRRSDDQWIQNAKQHPDSTYIIFSNLSPLTHKPHSEHSKTFTLARFNCKTVLELASPEKLSIFLGVECIPSHTANASTQEPESGWFAVETHLSPSEIFATHPATSILPCTNGFKELPRSEAAVAGMTRSLLAWHQRSSFCSICGYASSISHAGFKRTCSNSQCSSNTQVSNTCYPRIDPTVIMAISCPRDLHILLARSRRRHTGVMWSVLAGFIEPGESIEEACRREVLEETRVKVGEVAYHSSQPWPLPSSLMVGCMGKALSEEIVIDETELAEAKWFTKDELMQMVSSTHPQDYVIPPDHTIAHKLIFHWLSTQERGKEGVSEEITN